MVDLEEEKPETEPLKIAPPENQVETVSLFFLSAAILIILSGLLMYFALLTQRAKLDQKTKEAQSLETEIKSSANAATLVQFEQISAALKNWPVAEAESGQQSQTWSKLFQKIKADTYKYSQYTTLSINQKNEVQIDGLAKSFNDIASLIASLRDSNTFNNITLASTTKASDTDKIRFSLTAQFGQQITTTTTVSTPTAVQK